MNSCAKCDVGKTPNSDKNACEPCEEGKYRDNSMKSCAKCDVGKTPNSEKNACEPCEEGKYRDNTMTLCERCETGYEPNSDKNACEPCEEGKYRDNSMNSCAKCDEGKTPNSEKNACEPCKEGTYRDNSMTLCERCETGYEPNPDKTACLTCKAGTFKDGSLAVCQQCPTNSYSAERAGLCITCPRGSHASQGHTRCVSCEGLPSKWEEMMTETQFPLPPGDEVSLKCSPGHTLTGDNTVTCVEGTEFSFTNAPSCELDKCGSLPDTPNLITNTEFPVQYGVVLTVNCETGYYLSGFETITCIKDKIYSSHEDPTCIANTCTSLPEIPNLHASVQLQTDTQFPVSYGTIIAVQCSEDRTLRGDLVITCEEDKEFLFLQKPRCNDLGTCAEVPLDSNLYSASQFPVDAGTTVDVNCVAGHSLAGDRTITCIQDADYSSTGNFPSCIIDTCTELPDNIFNMKTNPPLPVNYGTVVELECIQGYSLSGSILITCIKDKNWKYEDTPHCVLDMCTELPAALSDMTTTSTFPVIVGTEVEVACKPGHTLAGDNTFTCEKGVIFNMEQRPTCTIDHCTRLLTENYLFTDSSFPVVYGTTISVSCEPGYSVMGSKEITCEKGIVFSHQISRPKCVNPGETEFIT